MNVRGWSTILYTPRILKNYTTNIYSAKKKKKQKKQKDSTNRKQEREYFTSNSAIQK